MQALSAAAPVVAQLKDRALRPEYARQLAGWLGMDVETVLARVAEVAGQPAQPAAAAARPPRPRRSAAEDDRPDPHDRDLFSEREVLKIAMQRPVLAGPVVRQPRARGVHLAGLPRRTRSCRRPPAGWLSAHRRPGVDPGGGLGRTPTTSLKGLATELAVEPILTDREVDQRYVSMQLASLCRSGRWRGASSR